MVRRVHQDRKDDLVKLELTAKRDILVPRAGRYTFFLVFLLKKRLLFQGAPGDKGTDGTNGTPGPPGPIGPSGEEGSCSHCPKPRTGPGYNAAEPGQYQRQ